MASLPCNKFNAVKLKLKKLVTHRHAFLGEERVTSPLWEATKWPALVDFGQTIPTKHFFKPAFPLIWFETVKLRSVGISCLWLVDCIG